MRKNLARTVIGLVVGGSLLVTSSLITMAEGPSGYDTLKEVFKSSHKIKNATFSLSGSINDNNKELVKVTSTVKADEGNKAYSGVVALDSEKIKKSYTFYSNGSDTVFKDDASDVYNRIACDKELKDRGHKNRSQKNRKHEPVHTTNPQMEAIGEKIIDTLVGDLKNQVEQKNLGNGEKQITINLDKNEIPSIVNLVLAAKGDNECSSDEDKGRIHEILGINPDDCKHPELTSNIEAQNMDVQIVVDKNNNIKEMDAEFGITGNDDKGVAHSQEFKLSIDVDDINSTSVDKVKLAGKKVKDIKRDDIRPAFQ